MKKFLTLLGVWVLVNITSFAQQNYYFWNKEDGVKIEQASQVDSLTFSVGSWLFNFSKPVCTALDNAFKGTTCVSLNGKVTLVDAVPEVGICYSEDSSLPTCADRTKVLGNDMKSYSFEIKRIPAGTTFYYRTYVKLLNDVFYGEVASVTTTGVRAEDVMINNHKFVDLGLPSGLLWAETNVGAASATDDGDYFAWGETVAKKTYRPQNYRGPGNSLTTLDAAHDVATVQWGVGCRMPSVSEFEELYNECEWTLQWDYQGRRCYIVTGNNGNTIFFPLSGYRYYSGVEKVDLEGNYWSSSLSEEEYKETTMAWSLYFTNNSDRVDVYPLWCSDFWYGFPVRPVAEK